MEPPGLVPWPAAGAPSPLPPAAIVVTPEGIGVDPVPLMGRALAPLAGAEGPPVLAGDPVCAFTGSVGVAAGVAAGGGAETLLRGRHGTGPSVPGVAEKVSMWDIQRKDKVIHPNNISIHV